MHEPSGAHQPSSSHETQPPAGQLSGATRRVEEAYRRIAEVDRPEVWITLRPMEDVLADAVRVDAAARAAVDAGAELPLAGRLLAVKDNIDVAGLPTTAACPDYAYHPVTSSPAVHRLVAAGAVVLGKTNLDQFATGLVGVRSPHGPVRDVRRPDRISGGSSSGSAVAVALGIADLALGTDTAGSGRVPAALQGVVGIKGTRGLVPLTGVVPACRSLDCVTVLAPTLAAAEEAMALITGLDPGDPTGRPWPADAPLAAGPRPRVGVPGPHRLTALAPSWLAAFDQAVADLREAGAEIVPLDVEPFLAAARLLYDGAFVAERYCAVGDFITSRPGSVDPTVATIIRASGAIPAHRWGNDLELLDQLRLETSSALSEVDAMLLPTTTEHPTIAAVQADPVGVNSRLGTYTNFANLLDLCVVAVPAGRTADGDEFGVSVIAPAFHDRVAADVARLMTGDPSTDRPGPPAIGLVVVGAHLSGEPLNHELTSRGARLVSPVTTSPDYALYLLDTDPPKPGLLRVGAGGSAIAAELWELPPVGLATFLAALPSPMTLGQVRLADGTARVGFLVEPLATVGARDISSYRGWRNFLRDR